MALCVDIGGAEYGILPSSLKIKSVLGGRSTAIFSLRGAVGGMTRFTRGQEVRIFDDEVFEDVLVSNIFGPYGAPGILRLIGHDGKAQADSVAIPANDWDAGSAEFLFGLNSGQEIVAGLLKQVGVSDSFFKIVAFDAGVYECTFFDFSLDYDEVDEGLIITVDMWTESGSASISTVVGDLAITDGLPYRLSVTWNYDTGTTTLYFYVDGVEVGNTTCAGHLVDPLISFDTIGWWSDHEVQPMVESYLADVRLWDDVRTPVEVDDNKALYLTGAEGGLIGYWKCDEGSGIVLDDETAGAADGELIIGDTGLPLWGVAAVDWSGMFNGAGTTEYQSLYWRHFGGRIVEPTLEKLAPGVYQQTLECADYSSRFDDKLVLGDNVGVTCGEIIQQYVPRHFEDDGIGCRTISPGPFIPRVRYYFMKMKKVLDELAKGADYIWHVDPYKELRFGPRTSVHAPFGIDDDAAPLLYLTIEREDVKGRYYNKLYARAKLTDPTTGDETTALYVCQDDDEIAARAAAEGSSGVYEHFEDLPAVRNNEHAVWIMTGMLQEAVSSGTDVTYVTREPGLRVGMLQHITHDELEIDGDFVIREITYTLEGGSDPRYDVVATSTKRSGRLSSMLDDAIESKSNFREQGIEWYLPVGMIGNVDGVTISDSLVITSGAIP